MSAPLTVAEVLYRAADQCARAGAWCQGASARDQFGRDVRESKCVPVSRWMLGHVAQLTVGDQWNEIFPLVASITDDAPTAWNDDPSRTQSEVVAKLRQAATLAAAVPSEVM